jgi:hypothetical protein
LVVAGAYAAKSALLPHRTWQSTSPGLAAPVPPAEPVVDENDGGGVNCIPGLVGRMTGGCWKLGVKPNCPAVKFWVPPLPPDQSVSLVSCRANQQLAIWATRSGSAPVELRVKIQLAAIADHAFEIET